MNAIQLFNKLGSSGLSVRRLTGDRLQLIGDQSLVDAELRADLTAHRQRFLDLLPSPDPIGIQSVQLGGEVYEFSIWRPWERLQSPIAIDTETELIEGHRIPRLALVSVSDGRLHRLIKRHDVEAFIAAHADAHFVAHNAAFDFAVLRAALRDPSVWVAAADQGRLHCTMLLDALIRLGRDDELPSNRDLGTVAQNYLNITLDKDDPYRLRYAELLDVPWETAEPGFFRYAIKDAIVTRKLWYEMRPAAWKITRPHREEMMSDAVERFGLLTESLQVRAAIALGQIERDGMTIDRQQIESTKSRLSSEITALIDQIQRLPETAELYKRSSDGKPILTATGKPATNQLRLRELLEGIANTISLVDVPRTSETRQISCSTKYWGSYADRSPFIALWVRLEETTKLFQFVAGLPAGRIHPRYTVLVRTGRTSCSRPNIQQLPRADGFHEMIVPSEGHLFLTIDYSAIELRTLAAVCVRRFGNSRLADVIREGTDPHAFTAAMFEGISPAEFAGHPERKTLRQRAKALNFGIPGGLGAGALVAYAEGVYGVTLTVDQASDFRERLITQVYPELELYLQEDRVAALASTLQTSAMEVSRRFDTEGTVGAVRRVMAGLGKAGGGQYGEAFINRIWRSLAELNANPSLRDPIANRETSEHLAKALFEGPVVTLTGRVRGKVSYPQAKNAPFQGLAADGAKLALWRLYQAGFRTVAFIHDEMLIELPIDLDHTDAAARIDRILCQSMAELTGQVPIACEYALIDRWSKRAERVIDAQGRLQCWQPS